MTDINRSSLLAKLKHIKGMKLLVEQDFSGSLHTFYPMIKW
ncbi:hypothetical protein [Aeromonas caviae]|nr:hypothetical protein [Aeromonas caviae]